VLSVYGLVGGTFGSHLSVSDNPLPPHSFEFDLGNSVIYMAGASADYAITRQWHANAGIDWTGFKYGRSALQSTGVPGVGILEPDSRTSNVTIKAGFGYSFY
jgi:opacity protein-like surface antigen